MQFDITSLSERVNLALAEQRGILILWIPVFLGLGSALYFGLGTEPSYLLNIGIWALSGLLAGSLAWVAFRADDLNKFYLPLLICAALFWTASGALVAQTQARLVATPMLASDNRIGQVTGRVIHQEVQEAGRGYLVVLDNVSIDRWSAETTPRKVRLTIRTKDSQFGLGDTISVLAKLHAASPPVTPGAFDFQRFYYFQGIGALGFSLKPVQVLAKAEPDNPVFALDKLRQMIGAKVSAVLSERTAGIGVALMTGDRAAIDEDDWQALRDSGLAHIISISGLHVALVAAPVFFVIRLLLAAVPYLALRWPIKKIAACVALMACVSYVAIVVPNVPTYRALLMTGIGLLAIMLDRSPFSMRLVAFAAAVVLLASPDSIWSASFQMSFGAVIALVAVADWMRPYWSEYIRNGGWMRKVLVYIAGSVMTTLIASLATNPFSSFHFQQIASYSVIANTLAIPLTGLVIMPMMIVSFLLMPFGLADEPLRLMGLGIEWMLEIAVDVAALPGSVIHTPSWPQPALVCFVAGALCLFLLAGRIRWLAAPLAVLGCVIILCDEKPRILVGRTGQPVLVADDGQGLVSSRRKEKFALETWLKRMDLAEAKAWPREGMEQAGIAKVICDAEVCRVETPGIKLSTGSSLYELRQDCAWADIIVVPEKKMRRCPNAQVYDRWRLRETGALAVMPDGMVRTVREEQGMRPWATWPEVRTPVAPSP